MENINELTLLQNLYYFYTGKNNKNINKFHKQVEYLILQGDLRIENVNKFLEENDIRDKKYLYTQPHNDYNDLEHKSLLQSYGCESDDDYGCGTSSSDYGCGTFGSSLKTYGC